MFVDKRLQTVFSVVDVRSDLANSDENFRSSVAQPVAAPQLKPEQKHVTDDSGESLVRIYGKE